MSEESPLDEEVWSRLVSMVQTAHSLNVLAYAEVARDSVAVLDREGLQKIGIYVWYLLSRLLRSFVCGDEPTGAELAFVAQHYEGQFSSVIPNGDKVLLQVIFCVIFDQPPAGRRLTGAEMIHYGLAALGVLYRDPSEDLKAIKPKLNAWCRKQADNLRDRGFRS